MKSLYLIAVTARLRWARFEHKKPVYTAFILIGIISLIPLGV